MRVFRHVYILSAIFRFALDTCQFESYLVNLIPFIFHQLTKTSDTLVLVNQASGSCPAVKWHPVAFY